MTDNMRQSLENHLFYIAEKCHANVDDVAIALASESVMRAIIAEVVMRK